MQDPNGRTGGGRWQGYVDENKEKSLLMSLVQPTRLAAFLGAANEVVKYGNMVNKVYQTYKQSKEYDDEPMPKRTKRRRKGKGVSKKKKQYPQRGKPLNSDASTGAARNIGKVRFSRKRKFVKVSNNLRKKIKLVIESEKLIGKYTHVTYYQFTPGKPFSGAFDDQQTVEYFGLLTRTGAGPSITQNRILFSPMGVLSAVGRLLNPTNVTKAALSVIDYNNIGTLNGYLNYQTAKIKVLKQTAIYRIRNNTGRSVTLKIYCLTPKTQDMANQEVGINPTDIWNSSLDLQDNNPLTGENPLSVRLETLYANPKMCSGFRQHYKIEETIVNIDAGKEYNYKVDGPSMMYEYAKYWTLSKFYDKQKFTKQVMMVAYNDLVRTTGGTTGRYTDHTVNDASSILVEQSYYIKFAIPDQVGFTMPSSLTSGANQSLTSRRYCFGIDNYQGDQAGTVEYVGDENPIDEATSTVV